MHMKSIEILHFSTHWSTCKLIKTVETELDKLYKQGAEILTVSFGTNHWYMPTAFITIAK